MVKKEFVFGNLQMKLTLAVGMAVYYVMCCVSIAIYKGMLTHARI